MNLIELLADADFEKLLEPKALLAEFAANRCWSADAKPNWKDGMIDEIEGRERIHSSLIIEKPNFTRRIWQAEVGILLPFVEEYRQRLLTEYAEYLPNWTRTYGARNSTGEIISDPHDLEIGNLAFLFNNARVEPAGKHKLENLRQIRNDLAHLRPVKPEILKSL